MRLVLYRLPWTVVLAEIEFPFLPLLLQNRSAKRFYQISLMSPEDCIRLTDSQFLSDQT